MRKIQSVGKKLSSTSGLSLLEVLVAVAFLGVSLMALISIGTTGLRSAGMSRDEVLADQYAREGVEILRSYRDNKGWDEFRQIARGSDWPIWGANGPTSPTCTVTRADRYYYVFEVPSTGVPATGTNGVACASHATFNNTTSWHHEWLNNWCTTTTWTTEPAGNPYLWRGKVTDNFYRAAIVGFETEDKAFVRSVVCYYDGEHIRGVQVDSYLTNWR